MVMIVSDGGDGHRLEHADGTYAGAIRNGVIRVGAFDTESELRAAALALWTTLDAALRRQYAGWQSYVPAPSAIRLVHDGAYEWVSDGRRPLARVIRPTRRAYHDSLRLEFVLPSYATEGVGVAAAVELVKALERFQAEHENTTWLPIAVDTIVDAGPA